MLPLIVVPLTVLPLVMPQPVAPVSDIALSHNISMIPE